VYPQMMKWVSIASESALTSLFVYGVMMSTAAMGADLSQYRDIQFGTDLSAVAKQVGVSASEAKVIHSRPALIQQLAWSPRALGSSPQTESVNKVIFSFYNGELYRIVINYDRYEIEGLTAEDMVDAISVTYDTAAKLAAPVKAAPDSYGDQEDVIARWQDPQYCFDLIRSSYGRGFSLIGVMTRLRLIGVMTRLRPMPPYWKPSGSTARRRRRGRPPASPANKKQRETSLKRRGL